MKRKNEAKAVLKEKKKRMNHKRVHYIKKVILANRKRMAMTGGAIIIFALIMSSSYMAANQFLRESAQKVGELSVENATSDIDGLFTTGENVVNILTDSISSVDSLTKEESDLQNYLDAVYNNVQDESHSVISQIFCYYEGNTYCAGEMETEGGMDISQSAAYEIKGHEDGEIFYVTPHVNEINQKQVITIARRFGTDSENMVAVDILVGKMQEYLDAYSLGGENTSGITDSNYEVLVVNDKGLDNVSGDDVKPSDNTSETMKPSDNAPENMTLPDMLPQLKNEEALTKDEEESAVHIFEIKRDNIDYMVFSKNVTNNWTVSYTVSVQELYANQFAVMHRIIFMMLVFAAICIVIIIVALQKELTSIMDPLTGLLNRKGLLTGIELNLKRKKSEMKAIVYMDLDNFKNINDTYGHDYGDIVLINTAEIVNGVKHAVFGRMGGDEFAGILYGIKNKEEAIEKCQVILSEIAKPIIEDEKTLQVYCSIGIKICTGDSGTEVQELVNQADQSMYVAKKTGKNQIYVDDLA